MSTLVSFGSNGLKKLDPTPTGPGGIGLNDNLQAIETALQARAGASHTHSAADVTSGILANARTSGVSEATPNTLLLRDASGNAALGILTASEVSASDVNCATVSADSAMFTSGITTVGASINSATIQSLNAAAITSADGSGISQLNASNLSTGTVPDARFPATLPALSGVNLTSLNASNVASGTIANARTTGTAAATANTLVLRNGSGDCSINNLTASTVSASSMSMDTLTADNVTAVNTLAGGSLNLAPLTGIGFNLIPVDDTYLDPYMVVKDWTQSFTWFQIANNGVVTIANGSGIAQLNASNIASGTLSTSRLPTGINAANIGGGAVSNTEFGYLDGVTSAIQTQLDGKASSSHTHSGADLTSGTIPDARLSSNVVMLAGSQTISGAKTFSVQQVFSDTSTAFGASTSSGWSLRHTTGSTNIFLRNGDNSQIANFSVGRIRTEPSVGGTQNMEFTGPESGINLGSGISINWGATTSYNATKDVGLARNAAGVVRVTNGSSGNGALLVGSQATGTISLTVRAIASQTASLQVWQNSSSSTLLQVTKDGYLTTPSGVSSQSTPTPGLSMTVTAGDGGDGLGGGIAADKHGGDAGSISITAGTGGDGIGEDSGDADGGSGGSIYLQAGRGGTPAGGGGYSDGEVVVNNSSFPLNFRVAGDTDPYALFVSGSNDRVGIGSSNPAGKLSVATGTITSALPAVNITTTWNSGGTTFTAHKINITDTASASASLFADYQVGGSSKIKLRKDGAIFLANGQFIRDNPTSGGMEFWPTGTSAAYFGLRLVFDAIGALQIGTVRASDGAFNVGGIRFDAGLYINDDSDFGVGASQQSRFRHTLTGNDTFQFGVTCNGSTNSGAMCLINASHFATSNRSPSTAHADPTLYVYSSDIGTASDYVAINHDQTDGKITIGSGALKVVHTSTTQTFPATTGTVTITAKVDLTDAATITVNALLGSHFRVTLGGNRTLGNPSNAIDGQRLTFELIQDGTGSRTLTLDTKYAYGTDIPSLVLTTTASKRDFLTVVYNSTADKFYVVGFARGY